jgi:chromosome segregation ATPase
MSAEHASGEEADHTVPKQDFDSLWEEFEGFKSVSAGVEAALNTQVEQQEAEIKRLNRLVSEAQSEAKDCRARLNEQQTAGMSLHESVHDFKQQIEQLRQKNRLLEDRCEALEHSQHADTFQQQRLEDTCHANEERAIIAEARAEELSDECSRLRAELHRTRDALQDADAQSAKRQQALLVAQAARDDAMRDMKLVAERLRVIAAKCGGQE